MNPRPLDSQSIAQPTELTSPFLFSESNLKVKYNFAKVIMRVQIPSFALKNTIKMNIDLILFYTFSILAFVAAFMVVTLSNAVHSVLFLIIVFSNVASLLLILGTEFFSFMFLIVYVGAIAVLFLFVVMMLNVKTNSIKINLFSIIPIGIIISSIISLQIWNVLENNFISIETPYLIYTTWLVENTYLTNVETIGMFLYTKYSLLFLLCGLILLVAMIGAIVLTMHQRPSVKKQEISIQLLRNPCGVIKFVDLRK